MNGQEQKMAQKWFYRNLLVSELCVDSKQGPGKHWRKKWCFRQCHRFTSSYSIHQFPVWAQAFRDIGSIGYVNSMYSTCTSNKVVLEYAVCTSGNTAANVCLIRASAHSLLAPSGLKHTSHDQTYNDSGYSTCTCDVCVANKPMKTSQHHT